MSSNTISVMGFPVTIDDQASNDEFWGEFTGYVGRGEIRLNKDLNKSEREHVLLHEIIHAVLHFTGVNSSLTKDEEEAVTTALANGLSSAGYRLRKVRS